MSETETVKRSPQINQVDWLNTYAPLVKNAMTAKQIADEMGMPLLSFQTRLSTMTRDLRVMTCVVKVGDKEMTGAELLKSLQEVRAVEIAEAKAEGVRGKDLPKQVDFAAIQKDIRTGNLTVVAAGKQLPQPEGSGTRGARVDTDKIADLASNLFGFDEDSEASIE